MTCQDVARVSKEKFESGRSWDTWMTFSKGDGLYHSYSQWVPESAYTPGEFDFHNRAKIFHRTSIDSETWTDHGLLDFKGEGPLGLQDHAYWSGSIRYHEGQFYLFYTRGGNQTSAVKGDQRILVATSKDGHNFTEPREIFSPETIVGKSFEGTTYAFESTASGPDVHIPSLRDPHIVEGPLGLQPNSTNSPWYLLVSTNLKVGNSPAIHGIGVARSENLLDWTLEAPMELPQLADKQIELPNLIEVDAALFGFKYLMMASARGPQGSEVLFWASQGLRDQWQQITDFPPPPAGTYGYNFVQMKNGDLKITYFDETRVRLKKHLAPVRLGAGSIAIRW